MRAYGDGAFSILPRSFLLPEGYWAWRLWRERCAAHQARRLAVVTCAVGCLARAVGSAHGRSSCEPCRAWFLLPKAYWAWRPWRERCAAC